MALKQWMILAALMVALLSPHTGMAKGKDGGGGDAIVCSTDSKTLYTNPQHVALLDYYDIKNGKLEYDEYFKHKGLEWLNTYDRKDLHQEFIKAFNEYGSVTMDDPNFGTRIAQRIAAQTWVEYSELPELDDDKVEVGGKPPRVLRWLANGFLNLATAVIVLPIDLLVDRPGKLDVFPINLWEQTCKKVQVAIQDIPTNTIVYNPMLTNALGNFEFVGLQWHEGLLGEVYPHLAGVDTTEMRRLIFDVLFEKTQFLASFRERLWSKPGFRTRMFFRFMLHANRNRFYKENPQYEHYDQLVQGWADKDETQRNQNVDKLGTYKLGEMKNTLNLLFSSRARSGSDLGFIEYGLVGNGLCESLDKDQLMDDLHELVKNGDDALTSRDLGNQFFTPGSYCQI